MRNFHSYMGGYCQNCGNDLGYIEVDGGRTRRYCNDACRKAASRQRSKRDKAVSRNESFLGLWDENGIKGEVREQLINILTKYGRDACLVATDAVITAKKETASFYTSRDYYAGLNLQIQDTTALLELRTNELSMLRAEKERLERQLARLESKEQVNVTDDMQQSDKSGWDTALREYQQALRVIDRFPDLRQAVNDGKTAHKELRERDKIILEQQNTINLLKRKLDPTLA